MSKFKLLATVCSAAVMLTGCLGSTSDLEQWVQDQEGQFEPRKIPLDPPLQFRAYTFNESSAHLLNPFDVSKMLSELEVLEGKAGVPDWILAELARSPREPLESVPLETISMVGTMQRGNRIVALARVGEYIHPLEVGAYLGQNLGKILSITETTIDVRELVPVAQDEWGERLVTLRLQEELP